MGRDLSAPLLRTARLLDLVPYLNTHQGIAVQDLAKEFGVSPSQIQADLTTLWMCGLPGYTPLELMDLEFESGYVTIRNAETLSKPRSISFQEGLALMLGLVLLQQRIPTERADLLQHIESLSDRISSKMGVPKALNLAQEIKPEIALPLLSAVSSSKDVQISYHSLYSDEITTRTVTPHNVFEENGVSYLQAYCFKAESRRTFRLDRILAITTLASSLTGEKERDNKTGGIGEKISFSIKIKNPTREIVERFDLSGLLKVGDGHNEQIFNLSSYSQEWIQRAISAMGSDVELVTPSPLRGEIVRRATLLLERYTHDDGSMRS
jgi:proteasome accessory factor C